MNCPSCKMKIELKRSDSLTVLEYSGKCNSSGWTGIVRSLRFGRCHNNRYFICFSSFDWLFNI